MTDEKMFMDLPQDEQQMLIEEIKKLKLTCEPKKMKASEIYALIDNAAQKVDIIQENNQEQSIISIEEQQNPDNVNQVLSETNDNEQPTVENLENNEKTVVNPEKNKQEQMKNAKIVARKLINVFSAIVSVLIVSIAIIIVNISFK